MTFNKDILFLHIGKTGGSSVRDYLKKILKPPIYIVVSSDDIKPYSNSLLNHRFFRFYKKRIYIKGNPHATIAEAKNILEKEGFSLDEFKEIVAIVRHPYDIELSLYYHLRKPHVVERIRKHGREEGKIRVEAASNTFSDFVDKDIYHRLGIKYEDYVLLDGRLPKNLIIVKFEDIERELLRIAERYGTRSDISFPHLNSSKRIMKREDIHQTDKLKIQDKYAWIFDQGFYEC